jgi:hypothetical protein
VFVVYVFWVSVDGALFQKTSITDTAEKASQTTVLFDPIHECVLVVYVFWDSVHGAVCQKTSITDSAEKASQTTVLFDPIH